MKIYNSIENFVTIDKAVVTIGTFDGVHRGHQMLIKRMKEIAKIEKGETVLLTFFPHPRMVLYPETENLVLINTMDEKISLLKKFGIDHLIIHPFTKEFSQLSSEDFIKDIIVKKIGTKRLIIGYNHHFGKNREGSFEHLSKRAPIYGFTIEEIKEQLVDGVAISSTKIREAILKGRIQTANKYLGYDFSLSGNIIKGEQLGRSLGFPTANIEIPEKYKIIPVGGVYAVFVYISNKKLGGMLNIGFRPTVGGTKRTIEVNILDFNEDIYNKTITVAFKDRIRDEIKFPDVEALKKQLILDEQSAIKILSATYS